jgi:hypothetical protein
MENVLNALMDVKLAIVLMFVLHVMMIIVWMNKHINVLKME